MTTENIIVLSAFAVYMIIMIVIGFVYSKRTKNNADYFLGGRSLGGWTAAMSAQASDMSGWLLMGLPGSIYLAGTGEVWIAVGLLLGTILNWYIVSSRLRKYTIVAGDSLTIPSFFQNRYRDKYGVIKIVAAIIIAIFFAVYTASAFSSGAKLFATLFGHSQNGEMDGTAYIIGLIIASVVILVYTFMGGFKAVCTTDLIQGLLMLVAILAVPIVAYATLCHSTDFATALADNGVSNPGNYLNPVLNEDGSPISFVSIVSSLGWGLGYFGMPHIIIRFMAIKNQQEVKKSRRIAITWVIISLAASCLIGLIARGFLSTQLDGTNSETAFIRMIQQVFSSNGFLIFIGGIFLCGILAAVMSTADSQLLVTASAVSEDLFPPRKNEWVEWGEDIIPVNRRRIWLSILFTVFTCGIYGIYWYYLLVKNTRALKKDTERSCVGEMLCLVLVPFYSIYWWYTRGKAVRVELEKHNRKMIGHEVLYMILNIVGYSIVSMALMQFSFNRLATEDEEKVKQTPEKVVGGIDDTRYEKIGLWIGKIAVVIIAIVAFFIALNPNSSIMGLVSDAWAGFGAAFGPVVLLALFWKRSTLAGAIAGMATGALTVIVWDYIPLVNGETIGSVTGLYSLVVGFALAFVVNFVVSLISKKPSKEITDEFESIKTMEI